MKNGDENGDENGGKMELAKLLTALDREAATTAAWRMVAAFPFVLGLALSGFSPWEHASLLFIAACPVCLWLIRRYRRRVGDWPRCAACGRKLFQAGAIPATHRCPGCGGVVAEDHRPPAAGYELPARALRRFRWRLAASRGMAFGTALLLAGLAVVIDVAIRRLGGGDDEWSRRIASWLIFGGSFAVLFAAVAPYAVPDVFVRAELFWPDRLRRRFRRPGAHLDCPACGAEPEHGIVELTGYCTRCGVRLLAESPVAEPESAVELPAWPALKQYYQWRIAGLCAALALILAVLVLFLPLRLDFAPAAGAVLIVLGGLIWHGRVLPSVRRRLHLRLRCPDCGFDHQAFERLRCLLRVRRCLNCRRLLVRDGEAAPPEA